MHCGDGDAAFHARARLPEFMEEGFIAARSLYSITAWPQLRKRIIVLRFFLFRSTGVYPVINYGLAVRRKQ
jgi:hypothetical protein